MDAENPPNSTVFNEMLFCLQHTPPILRVLYAVRMSKARISVQMSMGRTSVAAGPSPAHSAPKLSHFGATMRRTKNATKN